MTRTILKIVLLILHSAALSHDFCIGFVSCIVTVQNEQMQNSPCCCETLENHGTFCVPRPIGNPKTLTSTLEITRYFLMSLQIFLPHQEYYALTKHNMHSYLLIRESLNKNQVITLMQSLTADLSSAETTELSIWHISGRAANSHILEIACNFLACLINSELHFRQDKTNAQEKNAWIRFHRNFFLSNKENK